MLKPLLRDVDCQVADGTAIVYNSWQMLLPSGRCYSHSRVVCLILFLLLEAGGRAMGLLELKLNLKSSVKLQIVLYATTFS